MIWQGTFMYLSEQLALQNTGFRVAPVAYGSTPNFPNGTDKPPEVVNPWRELKALMENTRDTVVFVVTTDQTARFREKMVSHGLSRYLIVDQYKREQAATNRNYPHLGQRLHTFVLQGEKK